MRKQTEVKVLMFQQVALGSPAVHAPHSGDFCAQHQALPEVTSLKEAKGEAASGSRAEQTSPAKVALLTSERGDPAFVGESAAFQWSVG